MLEYLKRLQDGRDRMEHKIDDITRCVSKLEVDQALIIQHLRQLILASTKSQHQCYIDGRL
jgi:hypothetical protein